MNLVFFDIECASVHKTVAKICAFGYVVCDENFNIIKKEDILINPCGGFHLTDRKGDRGLVLPYSYGEFKHYPVFPKVYPYIKELLEDKNNVVVGHSTMNDVKYLNLETKRFKLPSFEFSFSDSQLMYMTHKNDYSRQFGLEHIAESLGVEFTPHRAADDAYATMRIVEAMCKAYGCGYSALIEKLRITDGKISGYNVIRPVSRGFINHNAEVSEEKSKRAKIRSEFFDYVNCKRIKRGKLVGKTFTFSREIEDNPELSRQLIDKIYANGGRYSRHVTHSNYYIAREGDDTARTKCALNCPDLLIYDLEGLEELING